MSMKFCVNHNLSPKNFIKNSRDTSNAYQFYNLLKWQIMINKKNHKVMGVPMVVIVMFNHSQLVILIYCRNRCECRGVENLYLLRVLAFR